MLLLSITESDRRIPQKNDHNLRVILIYMRFLDMAIEKKIP